jgi:cytochrome c-type biogenesis protein CcmH
MSGTNVFWYVLGAMSGVAAAAVLLPLTHGLRRRGAWMSGAAAAAALAALGVYLVYGSPQWSGPVAPRAVATASAHGEANGGAAGTMAEAVAKLAARLSAGEGSDADWQLLAQSFDALGQPDDARLAREHRLNGVPSTNAATAAAAPAPPGPRATAADWADYADHLASGNGRSLQGEPEQAIAEALRLDSKHPKALWLAASVALEKRDYPGALKQWQALRVALPQGSPDVAIIDANIAETRGLRGEPAGAPRPVAAAKAFVIDGTVDIDAAMRTIATPGMTLFVFARAAPGGGPPLAALKLRPAGWPMKFTLDDGAVMLQGTSLASVGRVYVEARLSASGSVTAAPGDLLGEGAWTPTNGGRVALQLTRRRD